jgi:hypothetical protein
MSRSILPFPTHAFMASCSVKPQGQLPLPLPYRYTCILIQELNVLFDDSVSLSLFPQLSQVRSKDLPAQSPSIKSSLDILATLLQYKAMLKDMLPSDFIRRVWTELGSQNTSAGLSTVCCSKHMRLVFEAATEKELYGILKDLKAITVSCHTFDRNQ